MGKRYVSLKDKLYGKELYKVYTNMKTRCYNPKRKDHESYIKKGIKVCDEWLDKKNGFNNFYDWSIQNGFKNDKLENGYNKFMIDRIDSKGDYKPTNCRWADRKLQNNNKSDNINYTLNGKTQSLRAWCVELNISYLMVYLRYHRRHWDLEKAIFTPAHKTLGGNRCARK